MTKRGLQSTQENCEAPKKVTIQAQVTRMLADQAMLVDGPCSTKPPSTSSTGMATVTSTRTMPCPALLAVERADTSRLGRICSSPQPNPTDVLISMGRAMGANVPNFPLQTFQGVACPSYDGPYSSSTELASIKA
jgi:hypothetical protein